MTIHTEDTGVATLSLFYKLPVKIKMKGRGWGGGVWGGILPDDEGVGDVVVPSGKSSMLICCTVYVRVSFVFTWRMKRNESSRVGRQAKQGRGKCYLKKKM